jgi:hypothetical protein
VRRAPTGCAWKRIARGSANRDGRRRRAGRVWLARQRVTGWCREPTAVSATPPVGGRTTTATALLDTPIGPQVATPLHVRQLERRSRARPRPSPDISR